jgi:hypothetical protein
MTDKADVLVSPGWRLSRAWPLYSASSIFIEQPKQKPRFARDFSIKPLNALWNYPGVRIPKIQDVDDEPRCTWIFPIK